MTDSFSSPLKLFPTLDFNFDFFIIGLSTLPSVVSESEELFLIFLSKQGIIRRMNADRMVQLPME